MVSQGYWELTHKLAGENIIIIIIIMNCTFKTAIRIHLVLGKLCTKLEDYEQNGNENLF
jgi:hypothetical protein